MALCGRQRRSAEQVIRIVADHSPGSAAGADHIVATSAASLALRSCRPGYASATAALYEQVADIGQVWDDFYGSSAPAARDADQHHALLPEL